MPNPERLRLWVVCVAVVSSGCVIAPLPPRYVDGSQVVTTAPPPPQVEAIGVAPVAGMVWLGGYWGWGAGGYNWHRGYWAHGRPGHHWVPHAWVQAQGGWVHRRGHWRRG